ncbi:hypothetical protein L6164_011937 [Bauhinia variegata]|uniref:Uncharacterized protein n=1 Tax=Bauhinia variegata TaxID=167791 RepID=A0ACB9PBD1_BAUVA|nr:hypothetical protein L6164_011937 [Bauhinia variegata]
MKPRGKLFQVTETYNMIDDADDAGPYKGFTMHVSSTKANMRIGNQIQKKALIGSEIGARTFCEMEAGSF